MQAGASAGQLFDSWAGAIAPADYRCAVHASLAKALEPVRALDLPGAPEECRSSTGVGTGEDPRRHGIHRRRPAS
ncbi:MAG: uroporphyrinogen decarboxylase family protein [Microbacterium sp.]